MISATYLSLLLPLLPVVKAVAVEATATGPSSDVQPKSDLGSFVMAVAMIGCSEIGDKTFLIAALMAMRHPRWLVFSAAGTSLAIMTILSGYLGHTCVTFIPERVTAFLAGLLFLVFGYKLTMEGLEMSKDAGVEEEMAEVEEEIAIKDLNKNMHDIESGKVSEKKHHVEKSFINTVQSSIHKCASSVFSPVWIQVFAMVFLGELGDRSQISIIAMASDSDYWTVIFGAVIGHLICSAIAVVGGKYLANKISMRTITLSGALIFFVFALVYVYTAFTI